MTDGSELEGCPFCGVMLGRRMSGCLGHPNIPTDCPAQGIVLRPEAPEEIAAWNQRAALTESVKDAWMPIESAPKDGTIVLVWGCDECEFEDAEYDGREPRYFPIAAYVSLQKHIWWNAAGLRRVEQPTHWMPLPPPPERTAS